MKQRNFVDYGKAFELELMFEEVSSSDIYEQIETEIADLSKQAPYKGRYLDLEAFHNIGPFVDWRRIIGLDDNDG